MLIGTLVTLTILDSVVILLMIKKLTALENEVKNALNTLKSKYLI